MIQRLAILLLATALLLTGCLRVGQATSQEKSQLDAWSNVVTQKDRDEVSRQAKLHTEWAEKKKVQWMTQQYRARYSRERSRKTATQPATRSSTRPSTGPFSF